MSYQAEKTLWWRSKVSEILLMEEILHHLGCIKPCKQWDIYHINWCRISSINSIEVHHVHRCSSICFMLLMQG